MSLAGSLKAAQERRTSLWFTPVSDTFVERETLLGGQSNRGWCHGFGQKNARTRTKNNLTDITEQVQKRQVRFLDKSANVQKLKATKYRKTLW